MKIPSSVKSLSSIYLLQLHTWQHQELRICAQVWTSTSILSNAPSLWGNAALHIIQVGYSDQPPYLRSPKRRELPGSSDSWTLNPETSVSGTKTLGQPGLFLAFIGMSNSRCLMEGQMAFWYAAPWPSHPVLRELWCELLVPPPMYFKLVHWSPMESLNLW